MIAPLRQAQNDADTSTKPLANARRAVAQAFFECDSDGPPAAPPLPAWQAWLFVGWIALVAAIFCCRYGDWWKVKPY